MEKVYKLDGTPEEQRKATFEFLKRHGFMDEDGNWIDDPEEDDKDDEDDGNKHC